jgi:hypothetical protein
MMAAARSSETLVNFYQTTRRRYNPEGSLVRTHRRENLKSYFVHRFKKSVTKKALIIVKAV